jgi:hypothetical protein
MEWWHENFWNVYPAEGTARQFLDFNTENLKTIHGETLPKIQYVHTETIATDTPGVYFCTSPRNRVNRGITLPAFKTMKFDVVLASHISHIDLFQRLISQYMPNAKFIFQAGNDNWNYPIKNYLTSAKKSNSTWPNANTCHYHQEFEVERFSNTENTNTKSIINLLHYSPTAPKLAEIEQRLVDWDIKIYGAGNRDGATDDLDQNLCETGFLWHVKPSGDGYGYNIHQAFAAGKPVIVNMSYHRGSTPEMLFVPGKTVIDVHGKSTEQIVNEIRDAEAHWPEWSARVKAKFNEVVNFESDAQRIKEFLTKL